jgi:hypothetical protein
MIDPSGQAGGYLFPEAWNVKATAAGAPTTTSVYDPPPVAARRWTRATAPARRNKQPTRAAPRRNGTGAGALASARPAPRNSSLRTRTAREAASPRATAPRIWFWKRPPHEGARSRQGNDASLPRAKRRPRGSRARATLPAAPSRLVLVLIRAPRFHANDRWVPRPSGAAASVQFGRRASQPGHAVE